MGDNYCASEHYPSFCFFIFKKHNVSQTEFCLRLQVEPTWLGPIDRVSPYLRLPAPSRVESYVTTDVQSASLSWNEAPIWGFRPDFITVRQLQACWYGALSLTRGQICRLKLPLVLASAVNLGSESRGSCDHILLSQIRDSTLYINQAYTLCES
jgi:hypothetical protein